MVVFEVALRISEDLFPLFIEVYAYYAFTREAPCPDTQGSYLELHCASLKTSFLEALANVLAIKIRLENS